MRADFIHTYKKATELGLGHNKALSVAKLFLPIPANEVDGCRLEFLVFTMAENKGIDDLDFYIDEVFTDWIYTRSLDEYVTAVFHTKEDIEDNISFRGDSFSSKEEAVGWARNEYINGEACVEVFLNDESHRNLLFCISDDGEEVFQC